SWTVLSALAPLTQRIELGTLVMCGTFRDPGLLAKMAATLDEVGDGRLVLGIGAGWHDPEYDAFGFPTDHRYSRFEEQVGILRALGALARFGGGSPGAGDGVRAPPPPRRVPILIAGEGPRMMRLAARSADAWNVSWFGPDEALTSALAAFDDALRAEGRDPSTI